MNENLKSLAQVEYGASPKEIKADDPTSFGIYGTGGFLGYAIKPLFKGPLIVVARKGTLDNPVFVKDDCWVIDTAFAVLPNVITDGRWLFYQLANYDLRRLNESTGVPSISRDYLYRLIFEKPSLSEQRKIASILSTIDSVIEKTEAAIAKYKAIKQGMMHDLLTRGLDKDGEFRPEYEEAPELYEFTELRWIPKEWELLILDDIVRDYLDFRGRTPLKLKLSWGNGDIKAISANNVEMGQLNFSKEYYTGSELLYKTWMTKGDCSVGDVIMTSEAPLGYIAQIPDEQKYILSQRVILFKTYKDRIDNDFLFWLMMNEYFQNELIRNSSGSTVTGIQQAKLSKIRVAIPSDLSEQSMIAKRLNCLQLSINAETTYLEKTIKLKLALMSSLLTGRVRVHVDKQEKTKEAEDATTN